MLYQIPTSTRTSRALFKPNHHALGQKHVKHHLLLDIDSFGLPVITDIYKPEMLYRYPWIENAADSSLGSSSSSSSSSGYDSISTSVFDVTVGVGSINTAFDYTKYSHDFMMLAPLVAGASVMSSWGLPVIGLGVVVAGFAVVAVQSGSDSGASELPGPAPTLMPTLLPTTTPAPTPAPTLDTTLETTPSPTSPIDAPAPPIHDLTPPVPKLMVPNSKVSIDDIMVVQVMFDEEVTGLTLSDFSSKLGRFQNLTGSGKLFKLNILGCLTRRVWIKSN